MLIAVKLGLIPAGYCRLCRTKLAKKIFVFAAANPRRCFDQNQEFLFLSSHLITHEVEVRLQAPTISLGTVITRLTRDSALNDFR